MTEQQDAPLSPDIRFQLVRKIECHKVIGLTGRVLLPHESKYLEFHRLSGVILFSRNIESLAQVGELVEHVDELLTKDGLPPLVMVDHEGDFVSELRAVIGAPPSAMAIAATGDTSLAHDVAYETGTAIKKLGVNVVLAPVADCYLVPLSPVTGLRTFGSDPERVAEYVGETIRGFHKAGVLTCAKHFPGHGSSGADSHATLDEVTRSLDDLKQSELVPFKAAVDADVDIMMTAHVAFSLGEAEGEKVPASFDTRLIRTVLRGDLGFDGAVITDALEMEGARTYTRQKYGGLTGGFERTLLAGSDLLLYSSSVPEKMLMEGEDEPMIAIEVIQTVIETLHKVVDRDRINKKLRQAAEGNEGVRNLLGILDASEQRVMRLRGRVAQWREPPAPRSEGNVIHLKEYASAPAIYKKVADHSIIMGRDPASFIPLDPNSRCVLVPIEHVPGESLKRQDLQTFLKGLRRSFTSWSVTRSVVGFERSDDGLQPVFEPIGSDGVFLQPSEEGARKRFAFPEDSVLLPVFSSRGAPADNFLADLSEFVEQHQAPFVLVTGWPLTDWIPDDVGYVLSFGASQPVAAATAAVLLGEREAVGTSQGVF